MSLNEQIVDDIKSALKAGDRVRLETLRMIRAALLELEKSGTTVTHEKELEAVMKQAKRRRDAADQYRDAGREDLAQKEEAELAIVEEYLPRQLSDAELERELRAIIAATGASSIADVKLVMPRAMSALKGRADGSRISALARELLSGRGT